MVPEPPDELLLRMCLGSEPPDLGIPEWRPPLREEPREGEKCQAGREAVSEGFRAFSAVPLSVNLFPFSAA